MSAPSAVVKEADVPAYIGYTERTTNRIKQQDGFPKPRDLSGSGKKRVYLRVELDAWLAAQPPAERQSEPRQLQKGRTARQAAERQSATTE